MVMAHYVGRYDVVDDSMNDEDGSGPDPQRQQQQQQQQQHQQTKKKVFDDSRSRHKPLTFIIEIVS